MIDENCCILKSSTQNDATLNEEFQNDAASF